LQAKLNSRNYGCRWTTADFEQHCAGNHTLYYYANWSCHWDDFGYDEIFPEKCILTYLDVDILKKQGIGTADDARHAMQILTEFFPDLYSEDNRRAYLHVYNDGLDRDEFKTLMSDFAKAMDARLKQDCNIEKFEIKGTPADIRRIACNNFKVQGYGVLAKLPTQLMERFDEFYGSAVIKTSDLRILVDKLAIEAPKTDRTTVRSGGSCELIPDDELDNRKQLDGLINAICPSLVGMIVNRHKITMEDIRIYLLIEKFKLNHPYKEDGANPWARTKAIWTTLYDEGKTDRKFNSERHAVIRDTLGKLGHLEAIDLTYSYATHKAACYRMTDHLAELVDEYLRQEGSIFLPISVHTDLPFCECTPNPDWKLVRCENFLSLDWYEDDRLHSFFDRKVA